MSHERRFNPEHVGKLEAPERAEQFPVEVILEAVGIEQGMNVADIGSGSGYFTLPLARRAAPGKVYAVDPAPAMLEVLRGKLAKAQAPSSKLPSNVELVLGEAEASGLPDSWCDVIFLSAVWHELDGTATALREFARIAAPEAKLVVVDWRPEVPSPPGPPTEHRVAHADVETALEKSGWTVVLSAVVTDWTYMVVAER
jgi:ubiquinone/menaquinone biosynthesis C-methylase UbiE